MEKVIEIYNELLNEYLQLKSSFIDQKQLKEDELVKVEDIIEKRKKQMTKIDDITEKLQQAKLDITEKHKIEEFNFINLEDKVPKEQLSQLKELTEKIKQLLKEIMELNQTITSDYESRSKGSQHKLKTVKQGKKVHKAYAKSQQPAFFLDKKS
ncbi:hypothetical protein PRVXT_000506 [Proteinivorax tanatarense]|uniref:FlgN protein n=1 Tax=Proteinivorax tanatarense TaxID=1260629 RepID=A0AAU7VNI4_9FIRM